MILKLWMRSSRRRVLRVLHLHELLELLELLELVLRILLLRWIRIVLPRHDEQQNDAAGKVRRTLNHKLRTERPI